MWLLRVFGHRSPEKPPRSADHEELVELRATAIRVLARTQRLEAELRRVNEALKKEQVKQ